MWIHCYFNMKCGYISLSRAPIWSFPEEVLLLFSLYLLKRGRMCFLLWVVPDTKGKSVLLRLKLEGFGKLWEIHWKYNFSHKEKNHKGSDSLETQTVSFTGYQQNHNGNHDNLQFHRSSNSYTSKNSPTSSRSLLLELKISRLNIINSIGRLWKV